MKIKAITFSVTTNLDTGRVIVSPDWVDDEGTFLLDDNLMDDAWTNDLDQILHYAYACYQITFGSVGVTEPASDGIISALQDRLDEDDTDILKFAELVAEGKRSVVNPFYSDEPEDDNWDDWYISSSTAGDYGPGNPLDAPGMSVRDFF